MSILLLTFWLVTVPINTLLHEIGHALAGLAAGSTESSAYLGSGRTGTSIKVGQRLSLSVKPLTGFVGGYWLSEIPRKRHARILVYASGPVFSVFLGIILWWLGNLVSGRLEITSTALIQGSYGAFFQGIVTLLPVRYGNWLPGYGGAESDGLSILRELKTGRE